MWIVLIIILWYLIGAGIGIAGEVIFDDEITLNGLVLSLTVGGLFGLFMLIPLVMVAGDNLDGAKVLWSRKKDK